VRKFRTCPLFSNPAATQPRMSMPCSSIAAGSSR
jgi:hypothetical protein